MKIAINPYGSTILNEYINLMIESFRMAYPDTEICEDPGFWKNYAAYKDIDVLWLNWYENLPSNPKQIIKAIIFKVIKLLILKRKKVKIIATFHNRQPHEVKFRRLNLLFYKWYLCKADNIIILCEGSRDILRNYIGAKNMHKVILALHPAYHCTPRIYPPADKKKPFSILFFGLLRPYKNVEMIIELAKEHPDILFNIAGQPITEEYGAYIHEISKGSENINLSLRYQSQEDIDHLIEQSSILLLPYNIKSSMNSGVLIYALSKGINVVIPEICSITDISEKDRLYTYKYSDEKEHKASLAEAMLKAQNDYENNYDEFVKSSIMLHNEIVSKNSIKSVSLYLSELKLSSKQQNTH